MPDSAQIIDNPSLLNIINQVQASPLLNTSSGVQYYLGQALAANEKGIDFSPAQGVLDATSKAIDTFTNPNANAYDITSGSLAIASSISMAIAKTVPGASIVAGPLGIVLGLAGTIFGAFGSARNNNSQINIMQKMLDDAFLKAAADSARYDLEGALAEMKDYYSAMSDALDSMNGPIPLNALGCRPDDVTAEGSKELGSAWAVIEDDVSSLDNYAVWPTTAKTFYVYAQVLSFKLMYMTQAVAYFNAIYPGPAKSEDVYVSNAELTKHLTEAKQQFGLFLGRPTLQNACLTNEIYKLPREQFDDIRRMVTGLGLIDFDLPERHKDGHAELSTYHVMIHHGNKRLVPHHQNSFHFDGGPNGGEFTHIQLYVSKEDDQGAPYQFAKLNALESDGRDYSQHPLQFSFYPVSPADAEFDRYSLPRDHTYWIMIQQGAGLKPLAVMGNNSTSFEQRTYHSMLEGDAGVVLWVAFGG
ncbi:hypothetical protein [Algihabitans albus]|uniref:hypothetical protein n=1 Tax=Algihabitans albus TaxID=2164067 RepID=UPI0013C2A69C|nr:hypothetical protein [Algihabitans albus]